MNVVRRYRGVIIVGLLLVLAGAGLVRHGVAQPADEDEAARLARGRQVRAVLLDALEKSAAEGGAWPERLNDPALRYTKLPAPPEGPLAKSMPAATAVVHEPFDAFPKGVWVGYADGHLEFAPTPAALKACLEQPQVLRESFAPPPTTMPAFDAGEARLKLVDPDGKPVAGARVGVFVSAGNRSPDQPEVRFAGSEALVSDDAGAVTLPAARTFAAKFSTQPAAPLYVLHKQRELVAQVDVPRSDFAPGAAVREIRMSPACRVSGHVTGLGLPAGRRVENTVALVSRPGRLTYYTIESFYKGAARFEVLLAPGDHLLKAYGTDSDDAYRYLRIAPGQRELTLHLDLPTATTAQLLGKPAPELRAVKGWKNTPAPLTLDGLRGKVVLLDFWGHWCGPCVQQMPALMTLYDEHHAAGLEIIAVHDDSVESVEEMDRRLAKVRQDLWAGRDLPFPVALDGGGPTRIVHTTRKAAGATTALYGIRSFPTTLLIDRDGKLVDDVDVDSEDGRAEILRCLRATAAPAK